MDYVVQVCKPGQGNSCCRYLIAGTSGLGCAKHTSLKTLLDRRAALKTMVAQADNCDGQEPDVDLSTLPAPANSKS